MAAARQQDQLTNSPGGERAFEQSPGRRTRRVLVFLGIGLLGLAMTMGGLAWDAQMHANDPGLAQREGVFTLSNLSHLMSMGGFNLAAVGLIGAAVTVIADRSVRVPPALLAGIAVLLLAGFAAAGTSALSTMGDDHHAGGAHGADGHSHGGMVHNHHVQYPDMTTATSAQLESSRDLLARVLDASNGARFASLEAARRAGYGNGIEQPDQLINGRHVEMLHGRNAAYERDGRLLDPERPESLVFWRRPDGRIELVGFMFRWSGPQALPVKQFGPIVRWHGHYRCVDPSTGRRTGVPPILHTQCPKGQKVQLANRMTHVWLTADLPSAYAMTLPRVIKHGVVNQ